MPDRELGKDQSVRLKAGSEFALLATHKDTTRFLISKYSEPDKSKKKDNGNDKNGDDDDDIKVVDVKHVTSGASKKNKKGSGDDDNDDDDDHRDGGRAGVAGKHHESKVARLIHLDSDDGDTHATSSKSSAKSASSSASATSADLYAKLGGSKIMEKSGIRVPVPANWFAFHSSVLFHDFNDAKASSKVAAFDFDGCLAKTAVFNKAPSAWSMRFADVPVVLKKLVERDYKLIIITNEVCCDECLCVCCVFFFFWFCFFVLFFCFVCLCV